MKSGLKRFGLQPIDNFELCKSRSKTISPLNK
jgi:hypothetical protein